MCTVVSRRTPLKDSSARSIFGSKLFRLIVRAAVVESAAWPDSGVKGPVEFSDFSGLVDRRRGMFAGLSTFRRNSRCYFSIGALRNQFFVSLKLVCRRLPWQMNRTCYPRADFAQFIKKYYCVR